MAWTTPATWVANATLTAAQLNTHVRDNLDFLYDAGRVRAETSDQTISNTTWTAHTWGAETYDTSSGMHSTGSLTDRFVAVANGLHYMSVTVGFTSNATGVRGVKISANGAATDLMTHTQPANNGLVTSMSITCIDYMTAADYWQVYVYQSSGGNLDTVAATPMRCTFGQLRG